MFTKKSPVEESGLEKAINDLLSEMNDLSGDDPAYATMVKQLSKLYKLKEVDHNVESGRRISRDTLLIVGGNLLGILMIVGHEKTSVLTSKALTLLTKLR